MRLHVVGTGEHAGHGQQERRKTPRTKPVAVERRKK
jgi:hypothetical protein